MTNLDQIFVEKQWLFKFLDKQLALFTMFENLKQFLVCFRGQIDENNPSQQDQMFAQQIVQKLIEELENRAMELPQQNQYFLLRLKFQDVANQFRVNKYILVHY